MDAREAFRERGESGVLRTKEALDAGVSPRELYRMRDEGELVQLAEGVYRLRDGEPPLADPDLVVIAKKYPDAVVCLTSALVVHDLTLQIPRKVHIARRPGSSAPQLDHPPIVTHRFSGESFTAGVETADVSGVAVRVYSPAKTVADCFKMRSQLGRETVVHALREYLQREDRDINELTRYAEICRVRNVMQPYLEAMLA